MRAIMKTGPYPGVELGEVDEPRPGPGEVLLQVEAASVCGTDIGLARWTQGAQDFHPTLPLVLGHECSGTIVELGEGVTRLAVGERVAIESHYYCGTCAACVAGARHNCLEMRIPGITAPGAFAPFMAAPASACFRLRDAVDAVSGALYEPAGVAAHALEQAGPVEGKTIAITGAGPVGLFLLGFLRAAGAGPVALVEPSPERRRRAVELGATVFDTDDLPAFVAFCRDHGAIAGADIGFEVSGSVRAYPGLFEALGRDATLVSVGHTSEPLSVDVSKDVNKRVIVWKGVFGRRIWSSWEYLDGLVADGRLDLTSFVELELDLASLPERLEEIATLPGKAIVRP